MGRDQDGGATQRIESPVGDVVEDVVSHGGNQKKCGISRRREEGKKKRFFKYFSAPPPASRGEEEKVWGRTRPEIAPNAFTFPGTFHWLNIHG